MKALVVLDFETSGMSPETGARPTEIGMVRIEQGKIVARFQSLMNPRMRIPLEIQNLTGITQAMADQAPSIAKVMQQAAMFAKDAALVAHNANFDRKFWQAELAQLGIAHQQDFLCTLLLARRVFPMAESHSLSNLIRYLNLPISGQAHRAQADADATAHLLLRMLADLSQRYPHAVLSLANLLRLQQTSRHKITAASFR